MAARLVHVNHRYAPYPGGSELFIQEISERFAQIGHNVRVVTSDAYDLEYFWDGRRRRVEAPDDVIGGVRIDRVPVRHIPGGSVVFRGTRRIMGEAARLPLPAPLYRDISMRQPWLPGLDAAIGREPADLIHATNLGLEGLAVTARSVAQRSDIPFVLTPFIHLGDGGSSVARRYVSMPHQIELLRGADAILAMTEHEAEFVSSMGVAAERIHVVGAGVSPERVTGGDATRFRTRHNIHGLLVGSIGTLASEKGTHDLVRAIQQLRRLGNEVELVLAGAALSQFERWYTGLEAPDRSGIHLLGVIGDEEKRDLLAAIDIFALPSRTESFGIVYLEAWANRKPVIAAEVGAVPELVRDGQNGLLVPFGNPGAIAEVIESLAVDETVRERLGVVGHDLVHARYTWAMVFDRVRTAYGHVLGTTLGGEDGFDSQVA